MVSPADVLPGLARAPVTLVPSPRPFELVLAGSADLVAGTADVVAGTADVARLAVAALTMLPVDLLASTLHPKPQVPIHFLRIHTRPNYTYHARTTPTADRLSYYSPPTSPRPQNSTGHLTTYCRDLVDSHETTLPDGWVAPAFYCSAFDPALDRP